MSPLDLLARARAQFETRLGAVSRAHHELGTPCSEWNVRALIEHVVRGDQMAVAILRGGSREEGFAAMLGDMDDDLGAAFASAADALAAEFATPGALERVVHHPGGDVPGMQLLRFRVGDYTYHAWDLARATGQDETLDPVVVEAVWSAMQGRHERMLASGMFGTGPSGEVGDDAPLQDRVLDMTGRRP